MLTGDVSLWTWFSAAGLLVLSDLIFGANFFLLWLGFCALVVGGVVYFIPSISWQWQCLHYFLLSTLCLVFWRNYLSKNITTSDSPLLNKRTKQFVGNTYTLATDITNGKGKVKIGDTLWLVNGPDAKEGMSVKVTSADGICLNVEIVN